MPICIECRCPVPQLYHVLHSSSHKSSNSISKASTNHNIKTSATHSGFSFPKALNPVSANIAPTFRGGGEGKPSGGAAGSDVRLTQCPRCKRFADKYVEHDFVVLFIDLVLVKPQVRPSQSTWHIPSDDGRCCKERIANL